jgi:hypothetical protein
MGLDIYVGSLTRYYARDWKTIVQQAAEAQGLKVQLVRPPDPKDVVTDKNQIRQAVLGWRLLIERGLGKHLRGKLDWDESDGTPYFTDKPDFEGWHAVQILAGSAATGDPLPKTVPADWTKDRKRAAAVKRSPYRHIVEPYVWLPAEFDDVFVAQSLGGPNLPFGSSPRLLDQLQHLNQDTLRATPEDFPKWRFDGPDHDIDRMTRFGLAVFTELAEKSVSARLPMLLDY